MTKPPEGTEPVVTVESLYRDHAATVLRWTTRLAGPTVDAEDTAHEVFAVAMRRLNTFRGGSQTAWLYAITRRVVANARRRARLRQFFGLEDVPPPTASGPGADEVLERAKQRRLVRQMLDELSAIHREVLVLVDLESRSGPEVAEMLGISVGTVYSRLHHARKSFAAAVRRHGSVVENGLLQAVGDP